MKNVLVTGGAGYIGSQMILHLHQAGYFPVVIDNLSSGKSENVLYGDFYQTDIADRAQVSRIIRDYDLDTVLHFAAFIVVEESVRQPWKYFQNNFIKGFNFLQTARQCGVKKFIFSSTAAVYGSGKDEPLSEDFPLNPLNPYGQSKAAMEMLLRSVSIAERDFRYVALRYFNVAGADKQLRLGQNYPCPTHLITRALKTALNVYEKLEIYGTDYPTPDGTAIRDYIDIDDLCAAHLQALKYLEQGGQSDVFNLGYGHGYSVRQVVEVVRQVTGVNFRVVESPRRCGDPAVLVADSSKARQVLGWQPAYNDLKKIISAGWKWEKKLLQKN